MDETKMCDAELCCTLIKVKSCYFKVIEEVALGII